MKEVFGDRMKCKISIMFLIFELIQSVCLIWVQDDVLWRGFHSLSQAVVEESKNGRYLTNAMTYFMCSQTWIRFAVHFFFMVFLYLGLAVFMSDRKEKSWVLYAFSAFFVFCLPVAIYSETITWVSGFTNYVVSLAFLLMYLLFCQPLLYGREVSCPKYFCLPMLFLGIAVSLCVEHITLYVLVFAVFVILLSLIKFHRVHPANLTFFAGAVSGALIMFSDRNYAVIASQGNDGNGYRFVDFSLAEIYRKIYAMILPQFTKNFFILHILLACSLAVLYYRKKQDKKNVISGLCLIIIFSFSCYSFFVRTISDFEVISPAYRTASLETAFTFIYICSILYLSFQMLEHWAFFRILFYIISSILTVLPFLIASPVSPRCFLADYFFWFLLTGELLKQSTEITDISESSVVRSIVSATLCTVIMLFSYISIVNKYCEILRVRYIKEQLAEDSRSIQIIKLPYENFSGDVFRIFEDELEADQKRMLFQYDYSELILNAYGIDTSMLDKKMVLISLYSYHIDTVK